VYFSEWSDSESARYLHYQIENNQQTKMYYSINRYWVICKNSSDLQLSVDEQPKHMSLVTTIPSDISVEALYAVMDSLNLGKVHSIQYSAATKESSQSVSINRYPAFYQTPLPRPVVSKVRDVYIHYDFWYRTRSATVFQSTMADNSAVEVVQSAAAGDSGDSKGCPKMAWVFYEIPPITDGINPNVWEPTTKPKVTNM
jgi:hypothetical protein